MCFSYDVYLSSLVSYFDRDIYASTSELLEPVLRPQNILHCGDEFM